MASGWFAGVDQVLLGRNVDAVIDDSCLTFHGYTEDIPIPDSGS